jgi:hypothetical protein
MKKNYLRQGCLGLAITFIFGCGDLETPTETSEVGASEISEKINTCRYPSAYRSVTLGQVIPRMWWQSAFDENRSEVRFDLQDFYCSNEYDDYSVLMVVAVTQSCPACGPYIASLRSQEAAMTAAGIKLLFVMLETDRDLRPTSAASLRTLNQYARTLSGVRVGSGSTSPSPDVIRNAPIITSVPSVFMVRRSDMRIIARRSSGSIFDPIAVARAAWNHQRPDPDDDDEADCNQIDSQNNHRWQDAIAIAANRTIRGSVCPGRDNFYLVDLHTRWRLKLIFQKRDVDLDLFLLDPDTGGILTKRNGKPLAAVSHTSNERLRHTAPAIARIRQFGTGNGAYQLTLKARKQRR